MIDVYSSVVAEEFGGKVNEWVAGGLTDGNRTAKFIPTLDALGVENYDEHTDHESVDLKQQYRAPRRLPLPWQNF